MYLGGEAFRKKVQEMVSGDKSSREVPRLQRLPARPRLSEFIAATLREFGVTEGDLRRRRTARRVWPWLTWLDTREP